LKHFAIEWRQEACAIGISGGRSSGGAIRMNVVVVLSRTHDGEELLKRVASFGPPRLVWSEVARVEMLQFSVRTEWTEIPASAKIGGWVDLLPIERRQKVGVPRDNELG
jgi:hypothetical protein